MPWWARPCRCPRRKASHGRLGHHRHDVSAFLRSLGVEQRFAVGHGTNAAEVLAHHEERALAVFDGVFGFGELGRCRGRQNGCGGGNDERGKFFHDGTSLGVVGWEAVAVPCAVCLLRLTFAGPAAVPERQPRRPGFAQAPPSPSCRTIGLLNTGLGVFMPTHTIRIWDLPTRLFHWLLAAERGGIGGDRQGGRQRHGVALPGWVCGAGAAGVPPGVGPGGRALVALCQLCARAPQAACWRYLQGGGPRLRAQATRHWGRCQVLALLGVLVAQVVGLLSDETKLPFPGPSPLSHAAGEWVGRATWFHADVGQYLVIGLVALHLLAIAYYTLVRRKTLVRPMLHGDEACPLARLHRATTRSPAWLLPWFWGPAQRWWWVAGLGTVKRHVRLVTPRSGQKLGRG